MTGYDGYRLSAAQLHQWRLDPGRTVGARVGLAPGADLDRLQRALARLAQRHEALRLSLVEYSGLRVPLQVVRDAPTIQTRLAEDRLELSAPAWQLDPPSLRLLLRDLAALYGEVREQPELERLEFLDVVQWQAEQTVAAGPEPDPDVLTHNEVAVPAGQGQLTVPLPGLRSALDELGRPLESALLAAWGLALSRYLPEPGRMAVAWYDDGRSAPGTAEVVGPLGGYAPVWLEVPLPTDAKELLDTVDTALGRARQRHVTGQPCADAVVAGFACATQLSTLDGLPVTEVILERPESHPGPHLQCMVQADGVELWLTGGHSWLLDAVAAILASLPEALAGGSLRLLGADELTQLEAWGRGQQLAPVEDTLVDLLDRGLRLDPAAPAVVAPDGEIAHAALDAAAARLATGLAASGIGPEDPVLVLAARSWRTIAGFIGILRAGAMYVPVDPDQPVERLLTLARAVGARAVVAPPGTDAAAEALCRVGLPLHQVKSTGPVAPRTAPAGPGNAAYAVFTSGSTGEPKPVVVEHRSVVSLHRALATAIYPQTVTPLRVTVNAPFTFDASIKQLIQLASGHTLCVLDETLRRTPEALLSYLERERVDVLDITPSHLRVLLYAAREGARLPGLVLVGGEAVDGALWDRGAGFAGTHLMNLYGPTECTVDATAAPLNHGDGPSIGRPLPDTGVHLLDSGLRLVPAGAAGEICLSGPRVARGYLGDAASKSFVTALVGGAPARVYRTGDRGRWTADGRLEFLGRIDKQFKFSGYRVEPDEIASALRAHPGVADAVVTQVSAEDGPRLVAHVATAKPVVDLRRVQGLNPHETRYLHDEIVVRGGYLRHGITLTDGAVVLDVGANIGMFGLLVKAACPTARIVAFEPLSAAFDLLRRNVEGITPLDYGLSDRDGAVEFASYPGYSMMSGRLDYADPEAEKRVIKRYLTNQSERGDQEGAELLAAADELLADRFEMRRETCRLRRLSGVLTELDLDRVDLLKIDVQRAELDVLRGIDDADWPRIQQIVMEVHDAPRGPTAGRLDEITRLLRSHGFEVAVEQEELLRGTDRHNLFARRGAVDEAGAFREWLSDRLPSYLVPGRIVVHAELPRTPHGKVDLAALSALDPVAPGTVEPAANPAEEILLQVWREVLGVPSLGVTDDFFTLGGDSIRAIRMRAAAQRRGLDFPLRSVFRYQSIRELVRETGLAPAVNPSPDGLDDSYPASALQLGMLYHSELSPATAAYHVVTVHHVAGPLDEARLRRAVSATVARHPTLRTSFDLGRVGAPQQLVHANVTVPLTVQILNGMPPAAQRARLGAAVDGERRTPFDWRVAPLLRLTALTTGEDFDLVVTHHHAIMDGWSLHLFVDELLGRYERVGYAGEDPLPVRRFVELEQMARTDPATLAFWRSYLRDASPCRLGSKPVPSITADLSAALPDGLADVAGRIGVPVKSLLLAAYLRALGEFTGRDDVVSGLVVSARPAEPGGDRTLGLFLNTVPIRALVNADPLADLALRLWNAERDLMGHHLLPGFDVAKGLFDTFFNYTRFHDLDGSVRHRVREPIGDNVPVDVAFTLIADFESSPSGAALRLTLQYDASQLDRERVRGLASRIEQLLSADPAGRPAASEPVEQLWRELLGAAPAGAEADFFAAGGDSLLALRMVAALRDRYGLAVNLAELRSARTFSAMTALVSAPTPPPPSKLDMAAVSAAVADEWCSALRLGEVDTGADFFALGGNSLMALAMAQRIEQRLGRPFPIDVLFLDGTLAAITAACAQAAP